ncbi:MurR/RpiR family transcriptional regulator [Amycolatopsis taiwanensis]|uniref:MurR/RpiR family transcriptional regulator n=1 Tax=Amycolatopsis taiwanensis TaxID=342230 RepID=UPI0004BBFADD|nr:MurR/RpiR family transcriptional regulator [Amycolatopsis taiwanensis]
MEDTGVSGRAPGSYAELAAMLKRRLPKLGGGQLRIAHLLLADPEGTAFRGIAAAARLTEVRESSIVRFANALGLPGYPAIMELCRVWLAEQARLARRTENADGSPGGLPSATLEQERTNLARSYGRLDLVEWWRAVEMLSEASRVYVIGLRDCAAVAGLLSLRLGRARGDVRRLGDSLVDELRDFAEREVLVAVSIRRYAMETVRVAEHARDRGLQVIALTDNAASPLREVAEVALFAETEAVGPARSLTACFSLAQALAAEVSLRLGVTHPDESPPALDFFYDG